MTNIIKGLQIIENFLSKEEEKKLLEQVKLSTKTVSTKERNSIARYGSSIPYNSRTKDEVIPVYLEELCRKLIREGYLETKPDSVSVNEYRRGQKTEYHFDSERSGPVITTLSLLGDIWIGMMKPEDIISKQGAWRVFVPRRALVIMEGEARYKYQHCIHPLEGDRISIVFRKGTL